MSQENVEIVRAVFEAWNAGDTDAIRNACDPEIIMRGPKGWPEPGPFFGQEAVMRAIEQLRDTFESDWQELNSDLVHVGDRVAVRTVWHGLGHGPELKQESTPVFTVRDGRVFHIEFFWDHAEALEALGLSEQAVSQENVQIVRAAYRAINSGDTERLLGLAATDIEIQASGLMLDQGTFQGHEGAVAYGESLREVWGDSLHIHVGDFIEQGDHVVVMARTSAKGKSSGAEVDVPVTHVWTIRAGKIVRFRTFASREEALEAAELSE